MDSIEKLLPDYATYQGARFSVWMPKYTAGRKTFIERLFMRDIEAGIWKEIDTPTKVDETWSKTGYDTYKAKAKRLLPKVGELTRADVVYEGYTYQFVRTGGKWSLIDG